MNQDMDTRELDFLVGMSKKICQLNIELEQVKAERDWLVEMFSKYSDYCPPFRSCPMMHSDDICKDC